MPEVQLVVMKLEQPLCGSDMAPLTDLEGLNDAIDFIW